MSLKHYAGFVFKLNSNNKEWNTYSKDLVKIGVYSVAKYFYDKLDWSKVKKILPDVSFESLDSVSNMCLDLSKNYIENWQTMYRDLLQDGESCVIALPIYSYELTTGESCFSVVNKVSESIPDIYKPLTKVEYAELTEQLYVLVNGIKPQNQKDVKYYLPAFQRGNSVNNVTSKTNTTNITAKPTPSTSNNAFTPSQKNTNTVNNSVDATKKENELEIKIDYIPTASSNRPATKIIPTSITIHSTANSKSTAKNERDNIAKLKPERDASFHIVVDDKEVIVAIPLDEKAYHAGAEANKQSIGIEICESGDRVKTLKNAIAVTAHYLKQYKWDTSKLCTHNSWTKKNCPRILIDSKQRKEATQTWEWFVKEVGKLL